MKRKISLLMVLLILIGSLSACSPSKEEAKLRVGSLKGPTSIGLMKLMDEEKEGGNLDFEIYSMADELAGKLVKNELDIAALPANLGATLYNKTQGQIKVVAINTLGVLYIVENGNEIKEAKDLEGKTIYSIGKGITPEAGLTAFLEGNGLENVNIEFKSEASKIAPLLQEEGALAMIPEPFVSLMKSKNKDIRTVFDISEEWEKLHGSPMVTGITVARQEVIDKKKKSLDDFLDSYKASIEYIDEDPETVARLTEEKSILPEGSGLEAIGNIDIDFIEGEPMEAILKPYLESLYNFNEKLLGGKLADEDFYYRR